MANYSLFKSPDGEAVLEDLSAQFEDRPLGDENPYLMAQKVGARDVIQYIKDQMKVEEKIDA